MRGRDLGLCLDMEYRRLRRASAISRRSPPKDGDATFGDRWIVAALLALGVFGGAIPFVDDMRNMLREAPEFESVSDEIAVSGCFG